MTVDIYERDTERPPCARAKGYIEDPTRPLIHGHAAVLLARAKSTTQGYLSRLSSVIRDQEHAASCVANALEAAYLDRMLCQRTEKPRLGARLQTYLNARLYGLANDNGLSLAEVLARLTAKPPTLVLEDGGCMISDASQARFDLGVAPESLVPYSDALVLEATLQPEAYQQAHDQRGKGTTHACANSPENRRYDIMGAIDADFPVVVGIQVDQAFEDSPTGLWSFKGPSLGGHALEVIAYDTAGVWIRNSWSDWGSPPPAIDASWIDDDGMPAQPPTQGFAHIAWDSVLGASSGEAMAVQWSASYSQDIPHALRHPRHLRRLLPRLRLQAHATEARPRHRGRPCGVRARRGASVPSARSHARWSELRDVARSSAGVERLPGLRGWGDGLSCGGGLSLMAEVQIRCWANRRDRRAAKAIVRKIARRTKR